MLSVDIGALAAEVAARAANWNEGGNDGIRDNAALHAARRLPPPRRPYGRTWAQVARDNFLASFPPGIPPWAYEALKPEHRPRTMTLAEILEPYTEDELAAYYY